MGGGSAGLVVVFDMAINRIWNERLRKIGEIGEGVFERMEMSGSNFEESDSVFSRFVVI